MICTLHHIARICDIPPGGISAVSLILPEDVSVLPEQYCLPNIEAPTLLPGKTTYTIYFRRDSARLVHRTNTGNAAGDVFEYTLTLNIREVRLSVEWLLAKLANRRVHALVTYRTGLQRLLPLVRTSSDSDSGDRIGSANQYTLTFITQLSAPAPTIGAVLDDEEPPPPTDDNPAISIMTPITPPGGVVEVPAGKLLHAFVITSAASDNTVKVGTTPGGEELMYSEVIPAGEHYTVNTAFYFPTAATVYITASQSCNIIIYLQ